MGELEYPAILVVDDEPVVRNLINLALHHDYIVLLAEDGVRALEIAEAFPGRIRLLMTDLNMPRMGGLEAARRFLAQRPSTQVLLMSGGLGAGWPKDDPRYSFLAKPFSVSIIRMAVETVLNEGRLPEPSCAATRLFTTFTG